MEWIEFENVAQLEEVMKASEQQPVMIFKHSTTCPISSMALNRVERKWKQNGIKSYYLDLHRHRDVSNLVATEFGIRHESPQVILLKEGKAVYNTSHMGINYDAIVSVANEAEPA